MNSTSPPGSSEAKPSRGAHEQGAVPATKDVSFVHFDPMNTQGGVFDLLVPMSFVRAKPISPPLDPPWSGQRKNALHWAASREFECSRPDELEWAIVCERHYRIYVNGRLAVRYRNFSNGNLYLHGQMWKEEINRHLIPGRNRVDVLIRSDPWGHKNHIPSHPFLCMETVSRRTGEAVLSTDGQWQVAVSPEQQRTRIDLGFTVLYERSVLLPENPGRKIPEFLRAEPVPCQVDAVALPPVFLKQVIPVHRTAGSNPLHVVDSGVCVMPAIPEGGRFSLSLEGSRKTQDLDVRMLRDGFRISAVSAPSRAYVVLEAAEIVRARVFFTVESESAGTIEIAYGDHRVGNSVDCTRMGRFAAEAVEISPGQTLFESPEPRAFRFAAIFFSGFQAPVSLTKLRLEEDEYLALGGARFACDSPSVVSLWKASLRTAQLCSAEIYMDNPDREQGQWIDNALPLMEAGYYWAGDFSTPAGCLAEFGLNQTTSGELPGYAPGKWFPRLPLQCHMALYVVACHNHFLQTGDRGFAAAILPVLTRTQRHWEKHLGQRLMIADLHTVFVDWGSEIYSYKHSWTGKPMPPTGILTSMNAYYLLALRRIADMAGAAGENALARKLQHQAAVLEGTMRQHLYDPSIGLFRDGLDNPLAERTCSQTANILAAWAGIEVPGGIPKMLERAFGEQALPDIIPANAQFSYQTLSALYLHHCDGLAERWMQTGFGLMLEHGYTTLGEKWLGQENRSICQGSGSAIAACTARYILGVYPAEPGYGKIGFSPHPGSLSRASGRIFTPLGPIDAEWRKEPSGLTGRIKLSPGLQGVDVISTIPVEVVS